MHPEKKQLRKTYIKKRESLDGNVPKIAERMVITHLLSLLKGGEVIAGYHAIRGEMGIDFLMKVLSERGHTMCLPAVVKGKLLGKEKKMIFREWHPGDALVTGAYGTSEPDKSAKATQPDILLVPLVAFDGERNRLGYGAGYYDRTINRMKKKNPNLKTVGIAYALQRAEKLPTEAHDEKLDWVLTETGII